MLSRDNHSSVLVCPTTWRLTCAGRVMHEDETREPVESIVDIAVRFVQNPASAHEAVGIMMPRAGTDPYSPTQKAWPMNLNHKQSFMKELRRAVAGSDLDPRTDAQITVRSLARRVACEVHVPADL